MDLPEKQAKAIRISDLTYRYADGMQAIAGINLEIARGETVAIVGPNGAGKTTLMLHLNGILPQTRASWWSKVSHGHSHAEGTSAQPASAGGVWIDGVKVEPRALPEIRKRVGLLFQDPDDQLFALTVIDDVAFGPNNQGMNREAAATWAMECLQLVGLEHLANRAPNHLSFGERKRVCLAGVLACRPSIIVMDEPTANLDPRARRRFIQLTASLEMTKVIVTHDLEMVLEICGRAILIDKGRVVAEGNPAELFSNKSLVEQHGLEVPISLSRP